MSKYNDFVSQNLRRVMDTQRVSSKDAMRVVGQMWRRRNQRGGGCKEIDEVDERCQLCEWNEDKTKFRPMKGLVNRASVLDQHFGGENCAMIYCANTCGRKTKKSVNIAKLAARFQQK